MPLISSAVASRNGEPRRDARERVTMITSGAYVVRRDLPVTRESQSQITIADGETLRIRTLFVEPLLAPSLHVPGTMVAGTFQALGLAGTFQVAALHHHLLCHPLSRGQSTTSVALEMRFRPWRSSLVARQRWPRLQRL
jgi:hypothetical protein